MQIKNNDVTLKNTVDYACEALQMEFRKQYVSTEYIQEKLDLLYAVKKALEAKKEEQDNAD